MNPQSEAFRITFDFRHEPGTRPRHHPLQAIHALCGRDDPAVVTLAFRIARSYPASSLQRIFSAVDGSFHSVHALLATTTYHYTLGYYSSAEIAERLQAGTTAGWPSPERPDSHVVRRFRNRNRIHVQRALERCLTEISEMALPESAQTVPHFARLIKAEARFRMHQAELADLEACS